MTTDQVILIDDLLLRLRKHGLQPTLLNLNSEGILLELMPRQEDQLSPMESAGRPAQVPNWVSRSRRSLGLEDKDG